MLLDPISSYTPEQLEHLRHIRQDVINALASKEDPKKIVSFLQKCCVLSIDEQQHIVHIGVPNEFVLVQVKKFFKKSLEEAIQSSYNSQYSIKFDEYTELNNENHPLHISMKHLAHISPKEPSEMAKYIETAAKKNLTQYFWILFEKKYQLENFVVGGHNQLAFAAAQAVISNPGQAHNPLFIYWNVGLGKTHLMQAMGNALMQQYPGKVIVYLPTTKLIDQIIQAMRANKLDALKSKLEEVDVLMLDDIQFLAGKDKTQELFHSFFNDLHSQGKQIVITSDQAPKMLTELEPRLQSRFALGLVVDIKAPDTETRMAIIEEKLKQKWLVRERNWVERIATTVTASIRDLEGALNTIMTRHELLKEEMSDDLIESSLETLGYGKAEFVHDTKTKTKTNSKNAVSQGWSNRESLDRCLTFLSHYYELSISDIKGPKRTKEISLARQCIMYILKIHLHWTYEKIGKEFGRGHASVIYAVETFTTAMQDDAQLKGLVEKCVKYGMG